MQSEAALTLRRVQLELISTACHGRRPARVVQLHATEPRVVLTHFLALRGDALLLDWPQSDPPRDLITNADVDVYFEHEGRRLACTTSTRGQMLMPRSTNAAGAAWRMALPLRVEPRQQRRHPRVPLADLPPIDAAFALVDDEDRTFRGRLKDLSIGGVMTRVDAIDLANVAPRQVYWLTFELPDCPRRFQFVVRVVHVQPPDAGGAALVGCHFCPTEDPLTYETQLRELAAFVAKREPARLRRTECGAPGGQ